MQTYEYTERKYFALTNLQLNTSHSLLKFVGIILVSPTNFWWAFNKYLVICVLGLTFSHNLFSTACER